MKIIYLIAGTYRPAGMERAVSMKANALAADGYDVVIVTTDQLGRDNAFPLDRSIRRIDLEIGYENNNGASFFNKLLLHPFRQVKHYRLLKELLLREKADAVVSTFCNDAAFLPFIKDGSHKVLEVHFSRYKRLQYGRKGLWALADRLMNRIDGRIIRLYDRFVVLTQEDKALWGQDPNISVIPNPSPFPSGTVSLDLTVQKEKIVLAAGRLTSQKGFDRLIRAWKLVPKSLKEKGWRLVIAGSGEDEGMLRKLITDLSLEHSVRLLTGSNDMGGLYASASLYAMTSRYEGLPMVLIEAQSAGLPIVAMTCKCGPRDVVTDGVDGRLVPDGDVEAMASALSDLMRSDVVRNGMSAKALENSKRYDIHTVISCWKELFDDICIGSRKKTVVVSGVNLRKGGSLAILQDCLRHLSGLSGEYRIIALVHKRELCDFSGIEYVGMPWCIRSWFHRLWAEYVTMHSISRRIAASDGRKVWLWLSMHDTTPRVEAERQEVYCQTSFPFLKIKARDWVMDPKIPLFALFTKWAYRINCRRNNSIIVQQNWFADALSGLMGVDRNKFRVIPPVMNLPEARTCVKTGSDVPMFLFAATADCHKNFETLCRAAWLLERSGEQFRLVLTIKGDENRYARWLYGQWSQVDSIEFSGFMTKEELVDAYSKADCFVCPSRVETWCLPISEYRAVHPGGKLLLADLPYARETSGEDALFFPVDDAGALKEMMSEIIRGL